MKQWRIQRWKKNKNGTNIEFALIFYSISIIHQTSTMPSFTRYISKGLL